MEYTILNNFMVQKKKQCRESTLQAYKKDIIQFLDNARKINKAENEFDLFKNFDAKGGYENISFVQTTFNNMTNDYTYKKSSINAKRASILVFFEWLVGMRLMDINPINKQSISKYKELTDSDKKHVLLKNEVDELLLACDIHNKGERMTAFCSSRDKLLIALMYCTGLRISEAMGIKLSDMDKIKGGYMINIEEHKTSDTVGAKRVPLTNKCLEYYEEYMIERKKLKHIADEDYLFLSSKGKKDDEDGSTGQGAFNKRVVKANIKVKKGYKLSTHCLRYGFRNKLMENNINQDLINMIGGWVREGMGMVYSQDGIQKDSMKIEACNIL